MSSRASKPQKPNIKKSTSKSTPNMKIKKKKTNTAAVAKTKTKHEPTPAAVLKKVATVSDSTKTLSKEIKSMTKIFAENQKVLVAMKNMIDTITGAFEQIQKQSKQINILEEDTGKLYAGLNQVRGQSGLITKINSQTVKLQDQIHKITEAQKSSPKTEKLALTVSESVDSIKNNSQMIIKIAQRIDEVRDDLRRISATKTDAQAQASIGADLEGIKKRIESISEKAGKIESLGGVIDGLKQQFASVVSKTDSISNLDGKIQNIENDITSLIKKADASSFVDEGLKSMQSEVSSFKENVFGKTNTIEQKLSSLSELLKRSDATTAEFHSKTDKVFQELQGIRNFTSKTSTDTSKEVMGLLKLSEFQSNIRMYAESKYGDIKDLEQMSYQTAQIVNLFDKLSIESQEKIALPHEVRQWAVSKILDSADKWEIRFSDVFNVLINNIGRDLLKEAVRMQQVRDIFGIRGVDELRKELNIPQTSSEAS